MANISETLGRLIPFGIDRLGAWKTVYEVKRGLDCHCTCPGCGGELVARQSQTCKVVWHFAHKADGGNRGVSCGETAIHLFAKHVLVTSRGKKLSVPRLPDDSHLFLIERTRSEYYLKSAGRTLDVLVYGRISMSGRGHGRSSGYKDNYEYLGVEIAVTNRKDADYMEDIQKSRRMSIIEIDLSPDKVFSVMERERLRAQSAMRRLVMGPRANRRWLHIAFPDWELCQRCYANPSYQGEFCPKCQWHLRTF